MSRTLDPALDQRILDAAAAIATADGLDAVTIVAVAERAKVGRPTVYRRWPTRAALIFEMQTRATVPRELPDTGDIRTDLRAAIEFFVAALCAVDREVQSEQLAAVVADPVFAAEVVAQRWIPDREAVHQLWVRAVERGSVDPDVDGRAVIDDIVGSVVFRVLLWHEHGTDWVEGFVDRLLDGVRPVATTR